MRATTIARVSGFKLALLTMAAGLAALPSAALASAPYGECRSGYWSSNRNLDERDDILKATCLLTWRERLSEQVQLGLGGRLGVADAMDGRSAYGRLREGFIEFQHGDASLKLGRQIIAWGRADRINPTDSFAPRDLTLTVAEDDEQRNGINAALFKYQLNPNWGVSTVLAGFDAHRIPQGSLPANLVRAERPDKLEWALKLDHVGSGLDWSVSYFQGYDRFVRYGVRFPAPGRPLFYGNFEKMRTLGLDFATAQGEWTMRGELGVSRLGEDCRTCPTRRVTRLVLGADRDFAETANINLQVFVIKRNAYQDPMALQGTARVLAQALDRLNSDFGPREWGMTMRLSNRFMNERLKLELGALADFTQHSYVLRPRLSYSISDSLKLGAGVDYFHGQAQSYFGVREKNTTAFIELAYVY